MRKPISGVITALITPFKENGKIDWDGLEKLIEFQVESGVDGILYTGTTGESPTLSWQEHFEVMKLATSQTRGRCLCLVGAGSNNTAEALKASEEAVNLGADALLLVDPYYNGPSSLEISQEYITPIARQFPQTSIIPYIVPGRTGCALDSYDLKELWENYPNTNTVKDATGDLEHMRRIRALCGPNFSILSGDDDLTLKAVKDAHIKANGVISVMSNIFPREIKQMVSQKKEPESALGKILGMVTVNTEEETRYGTFRKNKCRNPVPVKTMMNILDMPSGPLRRPLGKPTPKAYNLILKALTELRDKYPEAFAPLEKFFRLKTEEKIKNAPGRADLRY